MKKEFKIVRSTDSDGIITWNGNTYDGLIKLACFDRNREKGLKFILDNYTHEKDFKEVVDHLTGMNYTPVDVIILFKSLLNLTLGEANIFYQENFVQKKNRIMIPQIKKIEIATEFFTDEKCFITEIWNTETDNAVSIARARVEKGVTTKWHYLENTTERYVIIRGRGLVEIGDLKQEVKEGDFANIPPGCRQRITNIGEEDLVFDCICTPRFEQDNYFQIS